MEYSKTLQGITTPIPGLTVWELPVHGDSRGWFKENWQRRTMMARGLPDFKPVQNNVSFNERVGTTRGIHAEPWDKYISVATGLIFGAWVDMRPGASFGTVFTAQIDPSRAVFVPRGVGNAFQTLEPNTVYTYLVNDHYASEAVYTSLNLADETAAIHWPIPLGCAEISDKDRDHPRLGAITPITPRKVLVLGAGGQLGHALRHVYGEHAYIEYADRSDLELGCKSLGTARRWRDYDVIINAAAYTAVDAAESIEGRTSAWGTNVAGVAGLARIASEYGIPLVHLSTDYVFDGTAVRPYREDDPVSPLSVYGQTKAAGDHVVTTAPRHYIVRTSWVIGRGRNFVRTMRAHAERGTNPTVVDDQQGRLSFTSDLAHAIRHLIDTAAPYGIYNVTGSGPTTTWADIARQTFALTGHDPERITGVSTETYFASSSMRIAPRPRNSVLNLEKVRSTGYSPPAWTDSLEKYILGEDCGHGDSA